MTFLRIGLCALVAVPNFVQLAQAASSSFLEGGDQALDADSNAPKTKRRTKTGIPAPARAVAGHKLVSLDAHGKATKLMRRAETGNPAPAESEELRKPNIPAPEGRWLFGSQSCPTDVFPVDQMLPHQLHQSASRPFDHRILIVDSAMGLATAEQRSSHDAMLRRVQSKQLVDEVVDLNELKILELAKRFMHKKTAEVLVSSIEDEKSTWGMVVFLAKCHDGGYDHCAWLDGDIFVHRGSMPWMDEAIQRHIEDPQIVIGGPRTHPELQRPGFSSRYFVYHADGLQRLLPLKGIAEVDGTFEDLVNNNLDNLARSELNQHSVFETHRPDSWVIHPPDSHSKERQFLEACGGQGLSALIAIVEQGSEHGESAYKWRGDQGNNENMDAARWLLHIHQHCSGHPSLHQLLPLEG